MFHLSVVRKYRERDTTVALWGHIFPVNANQGILFRSDSPVPFYERYLRMALCFSEWVYFLTFFSHFFF
jgi:hypothetical protein